MAFIKYNNNNDYNKTCYYTVYIFKYKIYKQVYTLYLYNDNNSLFASKMKLAKINKTK